MKRLFLGVLASSTLLLGACSGGGGFSAVLPGAGGNGAQLLSSTARAEVTDFQQSVATGDFVASCASASLGRARCFSYVLSTSGLAKASASGDLITPDALPAGYGPSQLQAAYRTTSQAATGGTGRIIAIVDAFDAPTLEADLKVYRAKYGLPPCTTANGCFKKVAQTGSSTILPAPDPGWAQETSLDVDMVSANCPRCKILVVEALDNSFANLATAVNRAATMKAIAISNSYGGSEFSGQSSFRASYNHAGIAITASSGDLGYGAQNPASFPSLTAVGGTTLRQITGGRGWSETVWSGTGSGCSAFETKPTFQHDPSCLKRMIADVAYDADPNSGVAVYDSFPNGGQSGWMVFGGTSVGSPAIAAIYGLAGNTVSDAGFTYAHKASLFDVTSGSNGSCPHAYYCKGQVGYDGPTGNGTPNSTGAF